MEYREYEKKVRELTELSAPALPDFDKRGFTTYHVDHVVPIKVGFILNTPPILMASVENLQMLPCGENGAKNNRLLPNSKELLSKWGYSPDNVDKQVKEWDIQEYTHDKPILKAIMKLGNMRIGEAERLMKQSATGSRLLVQLIKDLHQRGVIVVR